MLSSQGWMQSNCSTNTTIEKKQRERGWVKDMEFRKQCGIFWALSRKWGLGFRL